MEQANTTTAVTKSEPKKALTLRDQLESDSFKSAVAKSLPKHLQPDRFVRIAITAMTRVPKLRDCEQASFFNALLTLSQLGLEPDGRNAHLIPFENRKRGVTECQLIIDYKGLVDLALRSGMVANIHADVVRENDIFEYNAGEVVKHIPHFLRRDADKPKVSGEVFAAYARVRFKDGTEKSEIMSRDDIDGIRGRSRAGDYGPWKTDFNEMAKKTVFRRLSKWLPLSAEFREALERDNDQLPPLVEQPKVTVSAPVFEIEAEAQPVEAQ